MLVVKIRKTCLCVQTNSKGSEYFKKKSDTICYVTVIFFTVICVCCFKGAKNNSNFERSRKGALCFASSLIEDKSPIIEK